MSYAQVSLSALNADAILNLDDVIAEEIYIQITGTFTGTLTPAASVDGTTYDAAQLQSIGGGAAVSTVTAPGSWRPALFLYGARFFRMRMTSYTSGTAGVSLNSTMTARA